MGAKIVQPNGRGPYTFGVNAQIYQKTSHMHPNNGQDRQFGFAFKSERKIIETSFGGTIQEPFMSFSKSCKLRYISSVKE